MWVTEDGVAHTVALPKPQQVMAKSFRRALDLLRQSHPVQVEDIVDKAEGSVLSKVALAPDEPAVRAQYEGLPPPIKILHGDPSTPDELAEALDRVEPRWRLDVVLALQDYLD